MLYIVTQTCVTEKRIYSAMHEYIFISCVTETGLKAAKEQHRDYLVATQWDGRKNARERYISLRQGHWEFKSHDSVTPGSQRLWTCIATIGISRICQKKQVAGYSKTRMHPTYERAETAGVSRGTTHTTNSAVSTPLRCISKKHYKKPTVTHLEAQKCSESAREQRIGLYKSDHHLMWAGLA